MFDLAKMTQAAMDFTEATTTRWTSRITGSEACLACGDYLKETMATFCESTNIQEFSVRPGAFLGYIRINLVLYFLGLTALFFKQIEVATVLATLAVINIVLEFFFYKEFVDFLFPKRTGKNVIGCIEPTGEVKQQIMLSGHHDSAHIFNFLQDDPDTYSKKILGGMLFLFVMAFATWLLFIVQLLGFEANLLHWILTGILTFGGFLTGRLWFFYSKEGTPGAGDNMICTALAIEIGKYFAKQKKEGKGLKHTRIMVVSWDAEEAGLRGSRAYAKQFEAELHKTKTYNLNFECMYDHRELSFLTSDLNNFVPLSAKMANECKGVSEKLGYNMTTSIFPFLAGGTDSAELAKIGIESTCLAAMSWTRMGEDPAYHTTRDTIEAVDAEAVRQSIDLGIHYILEKEGQV